MRSLLVQASTVEKAVDKAWKSAGTPTEFTIKILDFGEKGFLGLTKKNAIVSIIYEPQKQTAISTAKSTHTPKKTYKHKRPQAHKPQTHKPQTKKPAPKTQKSQTQKPQTKKAAAKTQKPVAKAQKSQQQRPAPKAHKPKTQKPQTHKPQQQKPESQKPQERKQPDQRQDKPRDFWTDVLINDATTWLKEAVAIIGLPTSIKAEVNKKALVLTFTDNVLETQDEERLLFSALSSLLMQIMKKKHKKKFHGYQMIITSKRFAKK